MTQTHTTIPRHARIHAPDRAGQVLTWMAPVFAAIGFTESRWPIPEAFDIFKVVCLVIVHACITLSITKILGRMVEEWDINRRKACAALFLAAFYCGVDIWLVHSGLGWIFDSWAEWLLYLAGAGYTGQALLREWVSQPTQAAPAAPLAIAAPKVERQPLQHSPDLAPIVERLERTNWRERAARAA